ncbi:phage integrase N-terminal SAM-like domain-containing protein [Solirubrobacter taibaiensis]|nr:phage integrase N-terminal SAM-like domain-containing protein [Solirubrobacter taibaiensis]
MRTPHRKTLPSYPEATTWRNNVRAVIRAGTIRKPSTQTILEAAELLLEATRDGSWLSRSGREYKPSTCRSYEQAVRKYLMPDPLAGTRASEVRRADIQDYVMRLRKTGLGPSTLTNKVDPLRVIFRRAMHRDEISIGAADDPRPPRPGRQPGRSGDADRRPPPRDERAFWATAFHAGLRRGDLRALALGATSTCAGDRR